MRLENRDPFPSISAPVLDGDGNLALPDDLRGAWSVILFYRGVW